MADERIEDITGGELTALAAADKFVVLDKSDTTDDADGTVKYAESATMGLWEHSVAADDADITAAVGVWYSRDISGYTADRTLRLPTTAAVGDRIAISLHGGDDTYKLLLKTTAASNDTINGVDHDTTEWDSLDKTGEVVVFRCVVANTAWIAEVDRRGSWHSFTMTIGGVSSAPTKGTVVEEKAFYRIIGNTMHVLYFYEQSVAGNLGSGVYLFPIPGGATIDTAKVHVDTDPVRAQPLGFARAHTAGFGGSGLVCAYDSSNLAIAARLNNGALVYAGSTNFKMTDADILYSFEAHVPVTF